MGTDDPIDTAKKAVEVVADIIKAAGDDPKVKEAGRNLAETAVVVTATIKNSLLPLAAVNFVIEKARVYFAERFQSELAERAKAIPADRIVEPKASIAGPALQGLALSHEESNLKDMYLNLLAAAMDGRVAPDVHPAFVEVIRQLSAEEAGLLKPFLETPDVAIVELRTVEAGTTSALDIALGPYRPIHTNILPLGDGEGESRVQVENPRMPVFVDNWVRLGLTNVSYENSLSGDRTYDWVEQRPEYVRAVAQHANTNRAVTFAKGRAKRTAFGEGFARAVGIVNDGASVPNRVPGGS